MRTWATSAGLAALVLVVGCGGDDHAADASDAAEDSVAVADTADTATAADTAVTDTAPEEVEVSSDPAAAAAQELASESEAPVDIHSDEGETTFATMQVPPPPGDPIDPVFNALRFIMDHAALYGLPDPVHQLYLKRVRLEPDGLRQHVFFGQRQNGLPVYAAELAVHLERGRIVVTNGHYLTDPSPPRSPRISASQAVQLAFDALPGQAVRVLGHPSQVLFNAALVRGERPTKEGTRLAWRVEVVGFVAGGIGTSWDCFVQADVSPVVGVLACLEDRAEADPPTPPPEDLAVATGKDGLSTTCWDAPGEDTALWYDETGATAAYPGAGGDAFEDGANVTSYAHAVYAFFRDRFGRYGWDGAGARAEVMVHAGPTEAGAQPYDHASWVGGCGHFRFADGWVTRDLVAHEWAHAVDQSEAELVYAFQSGSIAEAFADYAAIRFDEDDTLIGDGLPAGGTQPLRDFAHPIITSLADYDPSVGAPNPNNDQGGIHASCGIVEAPLYALLGSLGADKLDRLAYAVWVRGLTSSATFLDARNLMVAQASDFAHPIPAFDGTGGDALYGFSDADACAVANAWAAAGVGPADADCDGQPDATVADGDGDGAPDASDNCPSDANPDQRDTDHDRAGDACDPDADDDSVSNADDACPLVAGEDPQLCTDTDGDGWVDAVDNCPNAVNPRQVDRDFDDLGDACDPDLDGDGIDNRNDKCPTDGAGSQADGDGDGVGDDCDDCTIDADPDQLDCDGDGLGHACDGDEPKFAGGACAPAWAQLAHVTVHPATWLEIPPCFDDCGAWLTPDFEIAVTLGFTATTAAAQIVDERGRVVARAVKGKTQTLLFHPRPSWSYTTGADDRYQATRYFLVMPGVLFGPAYDIDLTLEHTQPEANP